MKSCVKCGKVVADSTPSCPQCGSFAFNTEDGYDGVGTELLNQLMQNNPKVGWTVAIIIAVLLIIGIIWFFGGL